MTHPTRTRLPRVARVVWVLGFLVGTVSHVVDLASGGLEVYAGFPTSVRLFWVSLTLLDPAVIVLVLRRLRAGVVLGVAVMIADVAVNWTVYATIGPLVLSGVLSQTGFALVVVTTARPLWRWFGPYPRGGVRAVRPHRRRPRPTMQGTARPPTDS